MVSVVMPIVSHRLCSWHAQACSTLSEIPGRDALESDVPDPLRNVGKSLD